MSKNAKRYKQADNFPDLDPRRQEKERPAFRPRRQQDRIVRPKTPGQADLIGAIDDSTIAFGVGPAGSGKTYISARLAAEALLEEEVDKIVLTRPAVGMGPTSGFLPGTSDEKIAVYLQPLLAELKAALRPARFDEAMAAREIEFAPLEFIRGNTFRRSFVILDEAQNCTRKDFEAFLTRLGEGSTYVVLGDNSRRPDGSYKQSDLPREAQGAIDEMLRLTAGIDDIEAVQLEVADCVRHPLVRRLLEAGL